MSGAGVGGTHPNGTPSPTAFPVPLAPVSGFAVHPQTATPYGAAPAAVGGTAPASASQAQANQAAAAPTALPTSLAPTAPAALSSSPPAVAATPAPQAPTGGGGIQAPAASGPGGQDVVNTEFANPSYLTPGSPEYAQYLAYNQQYGIPTTATGFDTAFVGIPDTWTPPPPSNAADQYSSTPTALDQGTVFGQGISQAQFDQLFEAQDPYNINGTTPVSFPGNPLIGGFDQAYATQIASDLATQNAFAAQQLAAQNAYQTELATYNAQEAAYNAALDAYQQETAAYNAQQATLAQIAQLMAGGQTQAANLLRQNIGIQLLPEQAPAGPINPFSNVNPDTGQPLPAGETPEQAYYIAHPPSAPPAPPQYGGVNSTGDFTAAGLPAPPEAPVGNPVGANAAQYFSTPLFGTGNTAGSLNASYQAQLQAAGGQSANFAGISEGGVGAGGGDQVPEAPAGQVDIGTPYETAPVPFTTDGTGPGELPYDIASGIPMPGYTPPADTTPDTVATPEDTFATYPVAPTNEDTFAAYAPPPPETFAPSYDQTFESQPPVPFADLTGQAPFEAPPESTFADFVPPQAPYEQIGPAWPGSGPAPALSLTDQIAQAIGSGASVPDIAAAIGATPAQMAQLVNFLGAGASQLIDPSQPIVPQLQQILGTMFGYPTMVGQLGELGVTPEGVQQALQPNVVAPELSGNIAPSPFGGTQGGFESPIGTFSTGASPDTWVPTPPADIPQAPAPSVPASAFPAAPLDTSGTLPQFLSGGLGLPPAFTQDPATMAALNNVAQALGISPAALAMNIMEESGGNPNATTGSYYGLLQEAASQNPAYTVLNPETAAALHSGALSAADQIYAYLQQWLPGYNIPGRMAAAGIDLSGMSLAQQSALLQGLQFAPNSSAWLNAVANNNQNLPSTTSRQAANLGPNTYGSMTAAFNRMLAAHPPMLGTGGAGGFVGPPMIQ